MKKLTIVFATMVICLSLSAISQDLTLRFTGATADGYYVPLDSVKVLNISRMWSETVVYPDTVLTFVQTGIAEAQGIATELSAYPNPFNGTTNVAVTLPQSGNVVLQMFNLAGQKVAERIFELQAGNSIFEVRLQKPQMYLLAVTTSQGRSTIKLINRRAGEGDGISYRGNVVEKRQTTQPFQSGDVLKIVGYASRPDLLSESREIQRSLTAGGVFTLLFDTVPEDGFLPEVFSVSANTRVRFSKGNLQYTTVGTHATAEGTAPGTWRFAPNQWDTIGAANSNVSSTYTGWIDLFAWGTSGYHDTNDQSNIYYQPYSSNCTYVDTAYNLNGYGPSLNMTDTNLTGTSANYDWGVYNAISNGGNRPGIWRTLTRDEWNYLLFIRNTSSGICYAKATVNGVPGLIILPDNWSDTVHYLDSTNNIRASYMSNCITSGQWMTYFEAHSCVFLPAAGERYVFNRMGGVGIVGRYWSSTCYGKGSAKEVYIGSGSLHPYYFARYSGTSVRLVRNEE